MVSVINVTQNYSVGYVSALQQFLNTANIDGQQLLHRSSSGFVWGQTSVADADSGVYNIDSQLLSFAGRNLANDYSSGTIDAISIILDGGANTYFLEGQYYGIPDVDSNDTRMFSGMTISGLDFDLSNSSNRAIILQAAFGNYTPLLNYILNRPQDYMGSVGNDTFQGGNAADLANTGGGNDILNGGLGADRMYGGLGNDTYYVDNVGDRAIEYNVLGYDVVSSSVNYSLAGSYVEHLWLSGTGNTTGAGNAQVNRLTGNSGNNVLNGYAGADTLVGNGGNDTLIGGLGRDVLQGGAGRDAFRFDQTPGTANADTMQDFSVPDDTIQLENGVMPGLGLWGGMLFASAFAANTTGQATNSLQRIIYDRDDGLIFYDADGIGGAARQLLAGVGKNLAMTNADFVVI